LTRFYVLSYALAGTLYFSNSLVVFYHILLPFSKNMGTFLPPLTCFTIKVYRGADYTDITHKGGKMRLKV